MNNISGFTFYASYHESLKDLDENDRKEMLIAIVEYVFEDKEPIFNGFKKMAWNELKAKIDLKNNDRATRQYKIWRKKIYERDNYTCQICGKRNCSINAHHLKKWSLFKKERYDIDNGITLCVDCHKKIHYGKS